MQKHIPTGWEEKPLIDFCEKSKRAIVDGPFGSNLKIIHYRKSGVPIITSGYVTDGVFKAEEYLYVEEEKFQQEIRSKVQGGDIVMAKIGARCGASAIMPEKHPVGLLSGNALKITVDEHQNSTKYVWYYLDWLNRNGKLAGIKATGAQPAVSVPALKKLPILRPPQNEQNRIVEILSSWDRAIETLVKLIDANTKLKKGLMQKLLTGEIRFKEFKNDKWQTVTLNDCCSILDNKRKPVNESERSQMRGDIPYYGANGLVDYVNDYIFDEELILMAEDGGYFDEFATRPIAYLISGKSWVNNHAHVLKAKEGFCQHLIFYCLVHKNLSKYLNIGTRSKLNRGELEKIEIDLPVNFNEQKRIADVLLSLDRAIDAMTSFSEKLKNQKKGLMQKLLTGKIRVKGVTQ